MHVPFTNAFTETPWHRQTEQAEYRNFRDSRNGLTVANSTARPLSPQMVGCLACERTRAATRPMWLQSAESDSHRPPEQSKCAVAQWIDHPDEQLRCLIRPLCARAVTSHFLIQRRSRPCIVIIVRADGYAAQRTAHRTRTAYHVSRSRRCTTDSGI
jgi:hypothetical protein